MSAKRHGIGCELVNVHTALLLELMSSHNQSFAALRGSSFALATAHRGGKEEINSAQRKGIQ